MAFLIAYMPERDAKTLTADFLKEHVEYAYKAKAEFPWAKEVPNDIFLNDVVAYVNLNEERESWRKDFYERFKKYVAGCKTMREAIDSVNKNIRDEVVVDYNTKREKADQALRIHAPAHGLLFGAFHLADRCLPRGGHTLASGRNS